MFLKERCSENMQQILSRTPMPKSDFNKITLRNAYSPVNLLDIFGTSFLKMATSECFWRNLRY